MISFVYFDLGGVVVHDFSGTNKWGELKKELGITAERDQEFESWFDKLEPEFCRGRDIDSIIPEMTTEFKLHLPKNYSLLIDGFVNRFEENRSIWPAIEEIKKNSRIGLLTNMYPKMFEAIKKKGILPDISWEIIIDSSVVGYQKPDREIYEIAEEKAGVKGSEIFFIENTQKNIDKAKEIGWQTFLYDSSNPQESSSNLLKYYYDHYKN